MSVNNLTTVGNVPAVSSVNLEVTGQDVTQEATVTRKNEGATQPSAASQAVLVALESFITNELEALAQKLTTRTTLLDKLPPEIRQLVQQIFSQTQTMQTALPAGLAQLLKSAGTASEKLGLLATVLEEVAGASTKDGMQPKEKASGKQQVLLEFVKAWPGSSPDGLKEAARILREVAAAMPGMGNQTNKEQDILTAAPRSDEVASRQSNQSPATSRLQPETMAATPRSDKAATAQQDTPATTKTNTNTAQPDQSKVTNRQQDMPLVLSPPDGLSAEPSDTPVPATQGAADADQPEPQVKGGVNHSEDGTVNANKPNSVSAEPKNPSAAMPATDIQQDNPGGKQQNTPNAAGNLGGEIVEQEQQTITAKLFASQSELFKTLPREVKDLIQVVLRQAGTTESGVTDMPEPMAALIKSSQPAADKLIMLASLFDEAGELLKPEAKFAMQTAAGGQQVLAEAVNALKNKNQEELKAAAKAIRELTETIPKPGGVLVERQGSHNVLTFTVPLYFGEGHTAYPAHIHVYHQEEEDKKNPGQQVTETWLRICLETENIGIVETAFRLYDGQSLDVKVRFNDSEVAKSFADSIPAVKEQLGQLPFNMGDFLVK